MATSSPNLAAADGVVAGQVGGAEAVVEHTIHGPLQRVRRLILYIYIYIYTYYTYTPACSPPNIIPYHIMIKRNILYHDMIYCVMI